LRRENGGDEIRREFEPRRKKRDIVQWTADARN